MRGTPSQPITPMIRTLPAFLLTVGVAAAITAQAAEPITTRMPEVTTTAPVSELSEEQPIGETGRPEWTSARRFTTTRVYIQREPWEVSFEQWVRSRRFQDHTWGHLFQEEIEIGLPYRMQLDLYGNWTADEDRRSRWHDFSVELRWALANWGKIPLNPTLYAEYKFVDENEGPDVLEFKLLLGEQLAPRLHWGLNLVWEKEMGGELTEEWQVSQGLSYSVIDGLLSIGAEMKYVHETNEFSRGEPEHKFLVGPSVQVRPTRNTHLDLVALIGTNEDSPELEAYLVFGIEFGKISGKEEGYAPVSLRSH